MYFRTHCDVQVLQQEQSYLQGPKLFSHAGKLKSLPWRLAILLHCWQSAVERLDSGSSNEGAWSRLLPGKAVQVSKQIFDYLTLQSQLLAPNSELLATLRSNALYDCLQQQYPALVLLLEGRSLGQAAPQASPSSAPVLGFPQWWDAMSESSKTYAIIGAHWVLASTSILVVDQASLARKLHDGQ